MGKPYRRKDSRFWWVAYVDAAGKRRLISSESEDEALATALLAAIERRVAAEKQAGLKPGAPSTLRWYAEEVWLPVREKRGIRYARSNRDHLKHVLPVLGHLPLKDVTRERVKLLVREIWMDPKKDLAPRSVRHVYDTLRVLFNDAVAEGLVGLNPCTLRQRRGELPAKQDKDLAWRSKAVFTRPEVEQLISDGRVPEYRRVLWGLIFLTGARINEVTPLRWRHYDPDTAFCGRLEVVTHYDVREKQERPGTKTGNIREVPVHNALARLLAAWKLSGWEKMHGHKPGPDDLIVEAPRGGILNSNRTLEAFKEDLEALGLRVRRQHDSRRTFISLARAGGADGSLLRWVTHGPSGSVFDSYTTPPWEALCKQLKCLTIGLREGKTLKMISPATALLRQQETPFNSGGSRMGVEGLEPGANGVVKAFLGPVETSGHSENGSDPAKHVTGDSSERSNVANDPNHPDRPVAEDDAKVVGLFSAVALYRNRPLKVGGSR